MDPACSTPAVAVGKGHASEIPRDPSVVALLTAPGRSAIAVIGIDGPASVEILSQFFRPKGRPLADRDDGQIVFGQWGLPCGLAAGSGDSPGDAPARGMPPEDLVVVKRSATSLEIHPHGGVAASERVLADVEAAGCRRLSWPEWLAATGCSEIGVEARVALAQATGPKAAAILCRQLSPPPAGHSRGQGSSAPEAGPAGDSLRGGSGRRGLLETEIDEIRQLAAEGNVAEAGRRADELLAWAPLGLRLTRPWRVVVKGRPNAGKSSLVNALAGFARSLVASEPGTTRDLLETRIVLDGWEIDLIDTAGLREDPASLAEQAGINRAREAVLAADLVIEVLDATGSRKLEQRDRHEGDLQSSNRHPSGSSTDLGSGGEEPKKTSQSLVILTKVDLLPTSALAEPLLAEASPGDRLPPDAIRTSAVTGEGIDTLAAAIIRRLVPREPGPLDAVPFAPRQVAEVQSLASP